MGDTGPLWQLQRLLLAGSLGANVLSLPVAVGDPRGALTLQLVGGTQLDDRCLPPPPSSSGRLFEPQPQQQLLSQHPLPPQQQAASGRQVGPGWKQASVSRSAGEGRVACVCLRMTTVAAHAHAGQQKPRLRWSADLHAIFVRSVNHFHRTSCARPLCQFLNIMMRIA